MMEYAALGNSWLNSNYALRRVVAVGLSTQEEF